MAVELTQILCFLLSSHMCAAVTGQTLCEQDVNCHLPDCFCTTVEHPMDRQNIPQMVYFGFDDAVTPEGSKHYDFLFRRNRTNPNGCPIGATLYISHEFTHYDIAKMYYDRGFELAVHSVSHNEINTGEKVLKEARDQRNNIAKLADVPSEEIVGWRSPNLVTAGDDQVTALQTLGYTYDISLTNPLVHVNDDNLWPFTLDFGCQFLNTCPKQKHKGFWEIPVNHVFLEKKYACVYTDGCFKQPNNAEEAFNFIIDNFKKYYNGNRAPFGINMHMGWFLFQHTREGMDRAIQEMLRYDDVYIITAKQVIQWMRHPTKISDIKRFKEWDCVQSVLMDNDQNVLMNGDQKVSMDSDEKVSMDSDEKVLMDSDEKVSMDSDEKVSMDSDETVLMDCDEKVLMDSDENIVIGSDHTVPSKPDEPISEGMQMKYTKVIVPLAAFLTCCIVGSVIWLMRKKSKKYSPLEQNLNVEYHD